MADTAAILPIPKGPRHSARACIHPDALRHNLARVRELAPASRVMAVVKANAYGHQIEMVCAALDPVDAFAVARLDEALALRRCAWRGKILLLEGVLDRSELEVAAQQDLSLVVHQAMQISLLQDYAHEHPGAGFEVWLKIDTGMNRLGFAASQAIRAYDGLRRCPAVSRIQLMTHLACADEVDRPQVTQSQLTCFDTLQLPKDLPRSAANSAAILHWPTAHYQWVRPGIMLYGVSPIAGCSGAELGLRPAMTLESHLLAVKPVQAGESVGYGGDYVAAEDRLLGIVAIGYGDGYPWQAPNGTPVWVDGCRVGTTGRVSMDMLAVDLSACNNPAPGDRVVLWGAELPVEDVAAHVGVSAYELVTRLTQRVVNVPTEALS